jgi:ABC-type Fe3+-hydroxamate transport system substrate-binding protein
LSVKQELCVNKFCRNFTWIALLFVLFLTACAGSSAETVTVEVTRVVTETVVTEGESVEVTRVVTETVETAPEEAPNGDLPFATGSEGDAEPLPPPPDDGPKVAESRGSTQDAELVVETAVTLRANQPNPNINNTAQPSTTTLSPTELQKLCQLATRIYKKRCS